MKHNDEAPASLTADAIARLFNAACRLQDIDMEAVDPSERKRLATALKILREVVGDEDPPPVRLTADDFARIKMVWRQVAGQGGEAALKEVLRAVLGNAVLSDDDGEEVEGEIEEQAGDDSPELPPDKPGITDPSRWRPIEKVMAAEAGIDELQPWRFRLPNWTMHTAPYDALAHKHHRQGTDPRTVRPGTRAWLAWQVLQATHDAEARAVSAVEAEDLEAALIHAFDAGRRVAELMLKLGIEPDALRGAKSVTGGATGGGSPKRKRKLSAKRKAWVDKVDAARGVSVKAKVRNVLKGEPTWYELDDSERETLVNNGLRRYYRAFDELGPKKPVTDTR